MRQPRAVDIADVDEEILDLRIHEPFVADAVEHLEVELLLGEGPEREQDEKECDRERANGQVLFHEVLLWRVVSPGSVTARGPKSRDGVNGRNIRPRGSRVKIAGQPTAGRF